MSACVFAPDCDLTSHPALPAMKQVARSSSSLPNGYTWWRGTHMPPDLYEAIVNDELKSQGIMKASLFPLASEYMHPPCVTFASGSRLYGLADEDSDWDAVVFTEQSTLLKTDDTEPYFRIFQPGTLIYDATRGQRHAWELLLAPPTCRLSSDIHLLRKLDRIRKLVETRNIAWLRASRDYFNRWYRHFFISVENESDPSIRRWKIKQGWPYKLGYFIYIDCYLARRAEDTGRYTLYIDDVEIRDVLCRMKKGKLTLNEWLETIEPILPFGCTLFDEEGRLPLAGE